MPQAFLKERACGCFVGAIPRTGELRPQMGKIHLFDNVRNIRNQAGVNRNLYICVKTQVQIFAHPCFASNIFVQESR